MISFFKSQRFLIAACLGYSFCGIGGVLAINPEDKKLAVGENLRYVEDPESQMNLDDFLRSETREKLIESKTDTVSLGYSDSTYWFEFELKNRGPVTRDLIVEIDNPNLDQVDVYFSTKGGIKLQHQLGDKKSFSERLIEHHNFLIPLQLKDSTKIILKVKSGSSLYLGLYAYDANFFWTDYVKDMVVQGLYFGIMLVMIIYNGFIYFALKNRRYLFYLIYVATLSLTQMSLAGFDYQYLFSDSPWLHEKSLPIFMALSGMVFAFFSCTFLELKEHNALYDKIVRGFAFAFLVGAVVSTFVPYVVMVKVLAGLISVAIVSLIFISFRMKDNGIEAFQYLVAFSFFFLGLGLFWLHSRGILSEVWFVKYGLHLGSAIEVVILSFALVRGERSKQEKDADSQKQASDALYQEIEDRTKDLMTKSHEAERAKLEAEKAHQDVLAAKQESDQAQKNAISIKEESDELRKKAEVQAARLKEIDQQKTSFFQNISHELRTPLTLILNPLESAANRYKEDKEISVAIKNSRRLLRLVNQLLDFQKLEAGKKELKLSPIDLNHFICICGDYFSSSCSKNEVSFSVTSEGVPTEQDSDPVWVMGEIDALEKIIFNFLSNALKYSPKGGEIELGIRHVDRRVRLFVEDTGVGISEEDQLKLFQVFSQVDGSSTRTFEGTGLGLALVKSLAEEMGGKVGVDSQPGEGSVFWVEFDAMGMMKPVVKVLIVEDNDTLRQSMVDSLIDNLDLDDRDIYAKSSVEDAMVFLEDYAVCCVVSDYNLPGKNGLDFMEDLIKIYPKAYRILMTANANAELLERAVNDKLVHQAFYKSENPGTFMSRIEKVIAEHIEDVPMMFESALPVMDLIVVDDDKRIRDALHNLLIDSFDLDKIAMFSNVPDALSFLEEHSVRCVLSDYNLGEEDGLYLLSEVGKMYPDTRRVLMTGEADLEIMERAVNQSGVDQVFYKPVDHQKLITTLERLVDDSPIQELETIHTNFEVKKWLLAEADKADEIDEGSEEEVIQGEGDGELILIVDDLADMRDLIGNVLIKHNYRTAYAADGAQGIKKARELIPNLIITDWMMPEVSGPELITTIKNERHLSSIPTILLTAKTDEVSKIEGTEVGADAFLGKPFNERELSSIVRNLLMLKSHEREVVSLNTKLTENVLKRYLPPVLVDQIVNGESELDESPKTVTATILFSDLVGFTELSSEIRAVKLARILNEYLEVMNEIVFQHGGTVDKFIGDSIMVIFGAPTEYTPNEQADRAARCALAMQNAMPQLNKSWSADGVPDLKMRIGVHQGPVIVGNFGSKRRSDYTAVGPTVNLASRIEGVCEPGMVYVSGEVCDFLSEEQSENLGEFDLKGIRNQQNLYKLVA